MYARKNTEILRHSHIQFKPSHLPRFNILLSIYNEGKQEIYLFTIDKRLLHEYSVYATDFTSSLWTQVGSIALAPFQSPNGLDCEALTVTYNFNAIYEDILEWRHAHFTHKVPIRVIFVYKS